MKQVWHQKISYIPILGALIYALSLCTVTPLDAMITSGTQESQQLGYSVQDSSTQNSNAEANVASQNLLLSILDQQGLGDSDQTLRLEGQGRSLSDISAMVDTNGNIVFQGSIANATSSDGYLYQIQITHETGAIEEIPLTLSDANGSFSATYLSGAADLASASINVSGWFDTGANWQEVFVSNNYTAQPSSPLSPTSPLPPQTNANGSAAPDPVTNTVSNTQDNSLRVTNFQTIETHRVGLDANHIQSHLPFLIELTPAPNHAKSLTYLSGPEIFRYKISIDQLPAVLDTLDLLIKMARSLNDTEDSNLYQRYLSMQDTPLKQLLSKVLENLQKDSNIDFLFVQFIFNFLEASQDELYQKHLLALRPYFEEIYLVLQLLAGPLELLLEEQPEFNPDKVDVAELAWRSQINAIVLNVLSRQSDTSLGPEVLKHIEAVKTLRDSYYIPIESQYRKRAQESILAFLDELRRLLQNQKHVTISDKDNALNIIIRPASE